MITGIHGILILICSKQAFSPVGGWAIDVKSRPKLFIPADPNNPAKYPALTFTKDGKFSFINGYVTGSWHQSGLSLRLKFDTRKHNVPKKNSLRWMLERQNEMIYSPTDRRLRWLKKSPPARRKDYLPFYRVS